VQRDAVSPLPVVGGIRSLCSYGFVSPPPTQQKQCRRTEFAECGGAISFGVIELCFGGVEFLGRQSSQEEGKVLGAFWWTDGQALQSLHG
jgi:hypothetical protein